MKGQLVCYNRVNYEWHMFAINYWYRQTCLSGHLQWYFHTEHVDLQYQIFAPANIVTIIANVLSVKGSGMTTVSTS